VNSVIGGSAVAIFVGRVVDSSLGVAVAAGVVAAAVSVAVFRRWDRILHQRSGGYDEVLFPSS
jgi:CBS-domain-containing membrane protein